MEHSLTANKFQKIRKSLSNKKIKSPLDNFKDMLQFFKDKTKKRKMTHLHNLKVSKNKDKDRDRKKIIKKEHKFILQSQL